MTAMSIGIRSRRAVLVALALSAACTVNESGNIPCNNDSNCPTPYSQCINATSGGAGKCVEAVVGTPALASEAIEVVPGAITGGETPGVTLKLPAISGDKNLVRKVVLERDSGGAKEAVVKTGGAPVTVADLGTTITVDAPATASSDDKTFTYTLTASNEPSSSAVVTAKGNLKIVPMPVLASSTVAITPSSIPSGLAPTLSAALPGLNSPATGVSGVSFAISGCGTGSVAKSGGGAVAVTDLGQSISIGSPPSTAGDSKTCTYTLTVTNTADTPRSVTATGSLTITPFTITTQPANATSLVGGSVTFSVTTSPTQGVLTYQWKKGGVDLAGKTLSSLTFNPVAAGDAGLYSVVVTNTIGAVSTSVTSNSASLNVAPVIGTQPASHTAAEGGPTTFSVVASVSAPSTLTYQWRKGGTALVDGTNISGSTTATLTINTVGTADAGTYSVVATSNLNGTTISTTSSNATLTVNQTPIISIQPSSITKPEGTTAQFTVAATAPSVGATLSYQWKKNGTNLTNGGNVSGALTATLTLSGVAAADEATYTVVVTSNLNGNANSVTSNGATLTVNQTPIISTQPQSQTVLPGALVTFNVVATAPSAGAILSYQWTKGGTSLVNGGVVSGATTATLTLTGVSAADTATYAVVVTSTLNSTQATITSNNATLVVNVAPTITVQPTPQNVARAALAGATFTVSATSSVGATLNYQWRKNGTPLTDTGNVTGSATNTLTLGSPGLSDLAVYDVVINGTLNATTSPSATSNSVPLSINDALAGANQRVGATATVLPNGKVLIAGGGRKGNNGYCAPTAASVTVEIFDPATGISSQLGGATPAANQVMSAQRCQHAAVLVGTSVYFFGGANTTSVDVFNTGTNTFLTASLPALNVARLQPTATLLGAASGSNSGKIVIAGGYDPATPANTLNSIELFTPGSTPATLYTAQLGGGGAGTGRANHTATLVDKWLFFIGGIFSNGAGASSSVDAIDTSLAPTGAGAAAIVNSTPSSNATVRWAHSAVALSSGTAILLIGGLDGTNGLLKSVQTYAINTTTGSASGAASANVNMALSRAFFPVLQTQTTDKFVVFGGLSGLGNPDVGRTSIELIDATGSPIAAGNYLNGAALSVQRVEATAVVFSNGGTPTFLVAGGDPGGASASGTYDALPDQ